MQVSTLSELDTHAIIGGGKAKAFRIAQTAEFFTVLSDTLYRDKKRAVVREVICNAWDAHIMAGKTDVPVEVTLTEEELVIRDFGPGIPHDKIGDIYCVYGVSTKVADENQTGGFGLGCKAPFAYSHHFSVMSCHDGYKGVYAISRGSSETDGRPDYREMVRVPTADTGIVVSIPLKERTDQKEFERIIHDVAWQGGMLVNLNGKTLKRLDYSQARERGYMVVHSYASMRESRTYVLYGTVLYPLVTTDRTLMDAAHELQRYVADDATIILIAPPNSIGITPSREALSYTDRTTKTLHRLIRRMKHDIKRYLPGALRELAHEGLVKSGRYTTTMTRLNCFKPRWSRPALCHPKDIAEQTVSDRLFYITNEATLRRVKRKVAINMWPDDRRVIRRLPAMYHGDAQSLEMRHSARLHMRLAQKVGLLNKLCVCMAGHRTIWSRSCVRLSIANLQGPAKPMLAIGPSQRAIYEFYKKWCDSMERSHWNYQSLIGLVVPNSHLGKIPEIKRLAAHYNLELVECDRPEPLPRPKPKTDKFYDLFTWKLEDNELHGEMIESAPVYIRATGPTGYHKLPGNIQKILEELRQLYPQVAVAINAKQEEKLKKMGARDLFEVLAEELKKMGRRRDVQYACLASSGEFINDHCHHGSIPEKARWLAKSDLRFAKLLFPARVAISKTTERALLLISAMEHITHYGHVTEGRNVIRDIKRSAKETFADLLLDKKRATEKFAYLAAVSIDCDDKDLLLNLIKYLQRQVSKSSVTEPETEALKEAA